MSTSDTTADARLRSVVAALWVEYNADDLCDRRRINRLIEDGAEIMMESMSEDELDAMGEAHVDDPIWKAFENGR